MSNFGINQNLRLSSIHRKHSRMNVQPQEENIFEQDTTFLVNIKDGSAPQNSATTFAKPSSNKNSLNSTKINRVVNKTELSDHF
jgi:hypothetical protein